MRDTPKSDANGACGALIQIQSQATARLTPRGHYEDDLARDVSINDPNSLSDETHFTPSSVGLTLHTVAKNQE